mgnify:CR=1 FL=1
MADRISAQPAQRLIRPAGGPVDAVIAVPGSKSLTNRALLLAALAEGESVLDNALFSEDSGWFITGLRQLGITVEADAGRAQIRVRGQGGHFPASEADVFVGNSGTTARFLVAAAALGAGAYRFDGVPRMRQRPIGPLLAALRDLGARVSAAQSEGGEGFPLTVHAAGLRGGAATLDSSASSQYLTALLQVAPYAAGDVTIRLVGDIVSMPYMDMTLQVMADFGVTVERDLADGSGSRAGDGAPSEERRYRNLTVRAGQRYRPQRYTVEPDASNASYFFAAAALTGGRVRVPGLTADSRQGDARFVEVLARMGCDVEYGADYLEVRGPARLRGIEVDLNGMSDTAQTLAAIAPFAAEPVTIRGIGHIRHKETDRIAAIVTELRRLGVRAEEGPDWVTIHPSPVRAAVVETYADHRMAMAFAVAGLAAPGIQIADPGCVAKTFPDFFAQFERLYGTPDA